MADFVGTWEKAKTENLDNYLESLGVPEEFRKIAKKQKETFIIAKEGDVWRTRFLTGDREQNASFKIGEPTEYVSALGKTMTGTIKSVGDKMIEEHFLDGLKTDITRETVNGQLYVPLDGTSVNKYHERKSGFYQGRVAHKHPDSSKRKPYRQFSLCWKTMADFVGTWERVKVENLDNYMDVLGIPENFRKIAKEQKETFIMAKEGDVWRIRYLAGDLEENASFKVGEPAEYMSALGKKTKGTIKSVGDKMIEEHFLDDMKMDVTKEIVNGQLYVTTTTNGVTCKAWYDRK